MQLEFSLNEAKNGLVVKGAEIEGEVTIPRTAEYEGKIWVRPKLVKICFIAKESITFL